MMLKYSLFNSIALFLLINVCYAGVLRNKYEKNYHTDSLDNHKRNRHHIPKSVLHNSYGRKLKPPSYYDRQFERNADNFKNRVKQKIESLKEHPQSKSKRYFKHHQSSSSTKSVINNVSSWRNKMKKISPKQHQNGREIKQHLELLNVTTNGRNAIAENNTIRNATSLEHDALNRNMSIVLNYSTKDFADTENILQETNDTNKYEKLHITYVPFLRNKVKKNIPRTLKQHQNGRGIKQHLELMNVTNGRNTVGENDTNRNVTFSKHDIIIRNIQKILSSGKINNFADGENIFHKANGSRKYEKLPAIHNFYAIFNSTINVYNVFIQKFIKPFRSIKTGKYRENLSEKEMIKNKERIDENSAMKISTPEVIIYEKEINKQKYLPYFFKDYLASVPQSGTDMVYDPSVGYFFKPNGTYNTFLEQYNRKTQAGNSGLNKDQKKLYTNIHRPEKPYQKAKPGIKVQNNENIRKYKIGATDQVYSKSHDKTSTIFHVTYDADKKPDFKLTSKPSNIEITNENTHRLIITTASTDAEKRKDVVTINHKLKEKVKLMQYHKASFSKTDKDSRKNIQKKHLPKGHLTSKNVLSSDAEGITNQNMEFSYKKPFNASDSKNNVQDNANLTTNIFSTISTEMEIFPGIYQTKDYDKKRHELNDVNHKMLHENYTKGNTKQDINIDLNIDTESGIATTEGDIYTTVKTTTVISQEKKYKDYSNLENYQQENKKDLNGRQNNKQEENGNNYQQSTDSSLILATSRSTTGVSNTTAAETSVDSLLRTRTTDMDSYSKVTMQRTVILQDIFDDYADSSVENTAPETSTELYKDAIYPSTDNSREKKHKPEKLKQLITLLLKKRDRAYRDSSTTNYDSF